MCVLWNSKVRCKSSVDEYILMTTVDADKRSFRTKKKSDCFDNLLKNEDQESVSEEQIDPNKVCRRKNTQREV